MQNSHLVIETLSCHFGNIFFSLLYQLSMNYKLTKAKNSSPLVVKKILSIVLAHFSYLYERIYCLF